MARGLALVSVSVVLVLASGCPPADPCAPNPCQVQPRTACTAVGVTAVCGCPAGTVEHAGGCLTLTPCTPNPCTAPHQALCEADGGAHRCLCEPGHAPEGEGCVATAAWDCQAAHPDAGDGAEPDECPPLAAALGPGETLERTLFPGGDQDWLRLQVVRGHVYRLAVEGEPGATPPLLAEVLDPGGFTVLAADSRGEPRASVAFVASGAGLLGRVRALSLAATGPYLVSLQELGVDDYPAALAEAPRLGPPASFRGEVQFPGDLDSVRLTLPGLTAVRVTPRGDGDAGLPPTLVLDLVGPDGGLVETLQQAPATVWLAEDGVVGLTARGRTSLEGGPFEVAVEVIGPDDQGDRAAWARRVAADGLRRSGRVEREGEVDVLTFTQEAGHGYALSCTSGDFSCALTAFSARSTLATAAFGSAISWQAEATEQAWVSLAAAFPATGDYQWALADLGPDDHLELPGTPLSPGTPLPGRLAVAADVDGFSFGADAGHVLQVTATATPAQVLTLTIHGPNGAELLRSYGPATFLAPATGAYRAVVRGDYLSFPVDYVVSLSDLGPDDFGGDASSGAPLVPGTPAPGAIQYAADVDAFTLQVSQGHVYAVSCQVGGQACSVAVRAGAASVPRPVLPGTGAFLATATGTWVLEVSSWAGSLGSYALVVTDQGPEDHGDTPATASALTLGVPAPGRLAFEGDHDLFAFPAQAGHVYRVTCGASLGCLTAIESAAGTPLGIASSAGGELWFLAPATGTLLVDVSTWFASQPLDYQLTVTEEGLDDHPGSRAGATALSPGTPAPGVVQFNGDVDAFLATLVPGHFYGVTCDGCQLEILDPVDAGPALLEALSFPSAWFFKATGSGPWLFRVSGGTVPFAYQLTLQDLGGDDRGETAALATPLPLGGAALAGVNEVPSDRDAFLVAGVASHVLGVSCAVVQAQACQVEVRDLVGNLLASASGSLGATARVLVGSAASLVVLVSSPGERTLNARYTVQAADLGPDDHGNEPAHATPITLGAPAVGQFQYPGDVDYFSVALGAGTYTLELAGTVDLVAVLDAQGLAAALVSRWSSGPFTLAAGTWYLRATPAYGELPQDYTLTLR